MRPFAFKFFIGILISSISILVSACITFEDEEPEDDQPVEVTWTGKVKDGYQDIAIPDQPIRLVETWSVNSSASVRRVFGDTIQTMLSDSDGQFSFHYTDPNEQGRWYCLRTLHPDYLDGFVEARIHPSVEHYQEDLILKPKAWLKIRVLDVPEQNISQTGIVFTFLNVDENTPQKTYPVLTIRPSNGDTTFFAFKPGGELTWFTYWDSDSMKTILYQAIFPPFDTTSLTFTY